MKSFTVKDFLVSIPHLCEAKNADRWSKLIELQFDHEIKNPGSVFARNEADAANPKNRLDTVFGFSGNDHKKEHCQILVELLGLAHYKHEHGEDHDKRIGELVKMAEPYEVINEEIAEVLPAEKAAAQETWNV